MQKTTSPLRCAPGGTRRDGDGFLRVSAAPLVAETTQFTPHLTGLPSRFQKPGFQVRKTSPNHQFEPHGPTSTRDPPLEGPCRPAETPAFGQTVPPARGFESERSAGVLGARGAAPASPQRRSTSVSACSTPVLTSSQRDRDAPSLPAVRHTEPAAYRVVFTGGGSLRRCVSV